MGSAVEAPSALRISLSVRWANADKDFLAAVDETIALLESVAVDLGLGTHVALKVLGVE